MTRLQEAAQQQAGCVPAGGGGASPKQEAVHSSGMPTRVAGQRHARLPPRQARPGRYHTAQPSPGQPASLAGLSCPAGGAARTPRRSAPMAKVRGAWRLPHMLPCGRALRRRRHMAGVGILAKCNNQRAADWPGGGRTPHAGHGAGKSCLVAHESWRSMHVTCVQSSIFK